MLVVCISVWLIYRVGKKSDFGLSTGWAVQPWI